MWTKTKIAFASAVLSAAGAANAADLIVDEVALEAAVPSGDWSGAYIGGHAGFAAGTVDWEVVGAPGFGDSYDTDGWLFGAQMGYNWQSDKLVFGLEGVVSLSTVGGDSSPISSSQTNWTASLLGRVGYDFDGILLYALAGVTVANATGSIIVVGDNTQTHVGGTIGAGVEALVADNVSVKAEYNYTQYGTATYDYVPGLFEVDADYSTHTVKAGVNFHF